MLPVANHGSLMLVPGWDIAVGETLVAVPLNPALASSLRICSNLKPQIATAMT